MNIQLNKAHFPVTVLGPGRRIGIWLQGCSLHCPGCVSRDTWNSDPEFEIDIELLVAWCLSQQDPQGVTISGGEPFDQPEALACLLDNLNGWRATLDHPFDVLCYSGYTFSYLKRRFPSLLLLIDAVITGPYIATRPTRLQWRGSNNQRLITLSKIGRDVYENHKRNVIGRYRKMQIKSGYKNIWFIGIPGHGDMDAIDAECRKLGLVLGDVSWRA